MSTSLLYHRFGIVGYHYVNQMFVEGATVFRIQQPREKRHCSACGSNQGWAQGQRISNSIQAQDFGKKGRAGHA